MPRLLLDKERCLANVERMARKAEAKGLVLRPHCKTHQSAKIGGWFRDFGVSGITVSSFRMARYFADAGWKDILVAFPFNPADRSELARLSRSLDITVLIDHPDVLPFLNQPDCPVGFYIDVDTGYGRSGIKAEQPETMENLLRLAGKNSRLDFRGFYCHAGHSYQAADRETRDRIHQKSIADLNRLGQQFRHLDPRLLYGDTPGCSVQEEFGHVDTLTPGNFVFYDLFQYSIGSCRPEDIAVAMECTAASRYQDPDRILIHGGAVHFSRESLDIGSETVYGQLARKAEKGWEPENSAACITGLSQEHGTAKADSWPEGMPAIGDTVYILPVHSCLTANLMRNYRTLEGSLISTLNS